MNDRQGSGMEIAVIGMACRYPGACTLDEYWENLKNGVESIAAFSDEELRAAHVASDEIENPHYVKRNGCVEDSESFDHTFFHYSPAEAELMDPQVRIFHECAWEALENAGYHPDAYPGPVGLYAGATSSFEWEALTHLTSKQEELGAFASSNLVDKDYLSAKVAYKLNLNGPVFTIQTACSTSLVAIHLACRALLMGECKMALAGGASVAPQQVRGYLYQEDMIFSPDGHCRSFDAHAKGTVPGNGVGVVVLKLLRHAFADGDHIYAIIKGSAINNDGHRKVNFTAPSVEGQSEVIRAALRMARVTPESITYVETHGTGTALGDPVEIQGLKLAFKTEKQGFCAIGSVKTNIGHLDVAAGVAGFMKTVLALAHKALPPSLHFETPNPKIDFEHSPFYVNTGCQDWQSPGGPLRAGVSSFGIGGTNAHIVLEEAPQREVARPGRASQLLLLSAKTPSALDSMTARLAQHLHLHPTANLADIAYTLQVGRKAFNYRRALLCSDVEHAEGMLRSSKDAGTHIYHTPEGSRALVFMFTGQGSQYVNMGLELYQTEPAFRSALDQCLSLLAQYVDQDVKALLYPAPNVKTVAINETCWTQPLLFAFEYALATVLMQWEIRPQAMIGHSIGEYVAACLAGVFSLEDALRLVVARGQLMQQQPGGSMLSISLSEEEVRPLLTAELSLAAINTPTQCVVSGSDAAISELEATVQAQGQHCVRLHTSHAFHSTMMDAVLEPFAEVFKSITLHPPQLPFISNVSGTWITAQEATDPLYWTRHLRREVRFADGIQKLFQSGYDVFLEVGPGKTLSSLVRQQATAHIGRMVVDLICHAKEQTSGAAYFLEQLGKLWMYGVAIDWTVYHAQEQRRRVPLPTYPFERQRFATPVLTDADLLYQRQSKLQKKERLERSFYAPVWEQTHLTDVALEAVKHTTWLIFVNDLPFIQKLVADLQQLANCVVVYQSASFLRSSDTVYALDPANKEHLEQLFFELHTASRLPDKIVHLWSVTDEIAVDLENLEQTQWVGYYSLLAIVQTLERQHPGHQYEIKVTTNNLQRVTGEETIAPAKATLLGAVKIIPLEYPHITCTAIDIVLPTVDSKQERYLRKQLARELVKSHQEIVVAYRGSHRWVQNFRAVHLEQVKPTQQRLRRYGVYLIVGGFGGMGFSIAEYLAKAYQARLILIGRSSFPERATWSQWLSATDRDEMTRTRIATLQEFEQQGAVVHVASADVADLAQMQQVVAQAQEQFGRIDGVIHAGGVIDFGGVIQRRTHASIVEFMNAKVRGTLVLDQIFRDTPLDFMALFSSYANVLYKWKFAQVSYNAANEFLDAFAEYKAAQEQPFTFVIDWSDWLEVGMAVRTVDRLRNQTGQIIDVASFLQGGLLPAEGVEAFVRIVNNPFLHRIIVSRIDLPTLLAHQDSLRTDISVYEGIGEAAASDTLYPRPHLSTTYAAPEGIHEKQLANLMQEFFAIDQIGIHDDFFELGGDSLKAMSFLAKVQKTLQVMISLEELFTHPTIKALADRLDSRDNIAAKRVTEPVTAGETQSFYPCSPGQKRIYILQELEDTGVSYNMPRAILIEGMVDRDRVEQALQQVVNRHEAFRTSFTLLNGELMQCVQPSLDFELEYGTLSDGQITAMTQAFIRPFDLTQAPLLRAGLFKLENKDIPFDRHILMIDAHHIVSDGFSTGLLLQEFSALYQGRTLPDLPMQYRDFVTWQKQQLSADMLQRHEAYLLKEFGGGLPILQLPTDFARPPVKSNQGDVVEFSLSAATTTALQQLAKKNSMTLFMVLLGVFSISLARYSGQEDLIIGTVSAGRTLPDFERAIGLFLNDLLLRCRPQKHKQLVAYLQEIKQGVLKAYETQYYPLDSLLDHLAVKKDLSRNALFDVMLIYNNFELAEEAFVLDDCTLSEYPMPLTTSKYDLTLYISGVGDHLKFEIEYSTTLFRRDTIIRFAQYLAYIAQLMTEHEPMRLCDLKLMPAPELERILHEFNPARTPFPAQLQFHTLIESQVRQTPQQTAIVDATTQWSYQELNARANRLALRLRKCGVTSDSIVGIMLERTPQIMLGMLAILKAGGAFLPLDPAMPPARIAYMLADSGATILVTQSSLSEHLQFAGQSILIDDLPDEKEEIDNLALIGIPAHLAYVIYTSGSTGLPKGVMIEHHSLVNFMTAMAQRLDLSSYRTMLALTTISFDISLLELFLPLMAGGTVVMVSEEEQKEPSLLKQVIEQHNIEIMQITPSRLQMLISDPSAATCLRQPQVLLIGGEPLSNHLFAEIKRLTPARLFNMYGPTEATIWVAMQELTNAEHVKLGQPLANHALYVVNDENDLQPIGVFGEIGIVGEGVARGYLGLPALTQEKFVTAPFSDERMYKTGDLARWLPDGSIEFFGRTDGQAKIRGYRVETGEIEKHLLAHGAVQEAVVAPKQDAQGIAYLVAYYVRADSTPLERLETALREHLSAFLPEYMIPSLFVELAEMPLTQNGKIDRKALPEPTAVTVVNDGTFEKPRTPQEVRLAQIWTEVLRVERVDRRANFFELGGHSLNAVTLAAKIHSECGVELPLREIFLSPTIEQMARKMEGRKATPFTAIPVVACSATNTYPLSSAQRRIFVLSQMERASKSYNMPYLLQGEGRPDVEKIRLCLQALVDRHEILRTSFAMKGDQPVQRVHDAVAISLEVCAVEKAQIEDVVRAAIRPFSLETAPLLRATFYQLDAMERWLLLLDIHHIICDAQSLGLLAEEFVLFYQGQEPPANRIQYKDYAVWQNQLLQTEALRQQEAYWVARFSDDLPVLDLPTDYPRPPLQSFEGKSLACELNAELTMRLKALGQATNTTLYMQLLAAYTLLLSKYSGQEDILVGSPIAGRTHVDLQRVQGVFINTLVMRNYPTAHKTFRTFLREVKEHALQAFENQQYPFDELVEKLNVSRDLSRNPLFTVAFVMQQADIEPVRLDGVALRPYSFTHRSSKFDLTLEAMETGQTITVTLEYCTQLFKPTTIERLWQHFEQIVTQVVAHPDRQIVDIELLTPAEREQLLVNFNRTETDYPQDETIYEFFERRAALTPDQVALVADAASLTYRQVNEHANQVARQIRSKGVQPDSVVALMVERSFAMVVGILGIWKAGGAYLPLDPSHPQERLTYILEDSGTRLLVTQSSLRAKVQFAGSVLLLDERHVYQGSKFNLDKQSGAINAAYVMYTSGTTGQPKGTIIEHHSLVNMMLWRQQTYPLNEADAILLKSPYTFDVSVAELTWWFLSGARLVVLLPGADKDPVALLNVIAQQQVTTLQFVPSLLNLFLEHLRADLLQQLSSLRLVFSLGEALGAKTANLFNAWLYHNHGTRLINTYGPTEATIEVTHSECTSGEPLELITIGKPIANTRIFVLSASLQLQPIGVVGELYIAGDGLARAYLNKPELTAERFLENPFCPGTRIYKTGDLARWLEDGTIEFLGRNDHQVKLRGLRIELEEIEKVLETHTAVRKAVVTVKAKGGDALLCAYLLAHDSATEHQIDPAELRVYLGRKLPGYMIPSYFVPLETLPLNSNGKLDLKKLPEPERVYVGETASATPQTDLEKTLATLWQEILGVEHINIYDNFFDAGGTSLDIIRFYMRMKERISTLELDAVTMFQHPTIHALAAYLSQQETAEPSLDERVSLQRSEESFLEVLDILEGRA